MYFDCFTLKDEVMQKKRKALHNLSYGLYKQTEEQQSKVSDNVTTLLAMKVKSGVTRN